MFFPWIQHASTPSNRKLLPARRPFVSVSSGQLTLTADHFGWPIAHLTHRNGWYEATKWPTWKLLERHVGMHGPCVCANNRAFCLLLTLTDALTVRPYRPLPVPRFSISAILPCNISHFVLQYDPFNRAKWPILRRYLTHFTRESKALWMKGL